MQCDDIAENNHKYDCNMIYRRVIIQFIVLSWNEVSFHRRFVFNETEVSSLQIILLNETIIVKDKKTSGECFARNAF